MQIRSLGRFQRCRDCRSWVDQRAEHCPLCGIAWPVAPWLRLRQDLGLTWRDVASTAGSLGGLLAGLALWQFWQLSVRHGTPWPLRMTFVAGCGALAYALGKALGSARLAFFGACTAVALAMPVAVHGEVLRTFPDGLAGTALTLALGGMGWFLGRFVGPAVADRLWETRVPHSVMEIRSSLEARRQALRTSSEQMRALGTQLASQPATPAQQAALHNLRQAVAATEAQWLASEVHAWLILTALWQNEAQPILATWRHLAASQCAEAITTLERMSRDANGMLATWQQHPAAADPRGQRAIGQLQRLLASVGQLRDAVLVRQATALAESAPGVRGAFSADGLPATAASQLDELRQGARMLDMNAAYIDLAHETERLRLEQEAVAEVNRLVDGGPAR